MIGLLAIAAICASGHALLRALRIHAGRPAVDVPLSWLAGSAWLGFASTLGRAIPAAPPAAVAIAALALPFAGWAASRIRGRGAAGATAPAQEGGAPPARWIPRPAWLFAPMAAWVLAVAAAVALHGPATPVHTDDAYRVRGLAPILAAKGPWNEAARAVVAMAGPVPTWVPALPWSLGAPVDPVQVSVAVVATFVAFLALLVTLASARGTPEAGWGAAFAVTSMPLFAYHAASTYADAWLALFLAAGFAFLVAFGRSGLPADAGRALLLLLGAAMVKREGELVALPMAAVLVAQVAWRERGTRMPTLRRLAPLAGAYALVVAARVAAVGWGGAFPFLRAAAGRVSNGETAAAAASSAGGTPGASAAAVFVDALFTDGNLGLVHWVLAACLVLLAPRIRGARLGWALAALALLFAETAASAIWLYPGFTLDHGTVHRSLLPVSAVASVWVAALLAAAGRGEDTPPKAPVKRSRAARRSRRVG
jgi:hypothetical protein